MAHTEFNRMVCSYSKSGPTVLWANKPITSISFDGGDRPEVIINTSTTRKSTAGLPTPRRVTIGMILDDPNLADCEDALDECDSGSLTVTANNCGTPSQFFAHSAWLMNYEVTAEMDGVYEVSLEFLIDERP